MIFDFDHPPDRRGSDSVKWGKYAGRDVLPMWVADMDFAAPPCVIEALRERVDHGVFGYGSPPMSLAGAVVEALQRDHGWSIDPDWLVWLPGLVSALNIVCRAVGDAGDEVLTATPVYPPFLSAPCYSGRRVTTVDLRRTDSRWTWDAGRLERAVTPRSRLLMLCNPHNPVGRVFSREELTSIAQTAERHDLVICSDEIHCGLVLDKQVQHLPIAMLDNATAERTITLMAPSKTWNIPGLGCAFAVVANPKLRRQMLDAMHGIVPHANVLGLAATEAAYRHGDPWRRELLEYLRGNAECVERAIAAIPGLSTWPVEATCLAWIDARPLALRDPVRFFEDAGVGLSNGADFGAPGYVRLNFGCARSVLELALRRIHDGVMAR
ncbi:MAG: putative C-S lyase [Sterolibacteriaceae bacterium]|nr:putative C-S lyase [Candidatus Methylophosphatis haderslevensis]